MDIKWLIPFLGGLACGIGGTTMVLDREYDKKFQEELTVLRKNFEEYEKELGLTKDILVEEKRTEYLPASEDSNTGRDTGVLPKEERVKIKENWAIDDKKCIDYTIYYTKKDTGESFEEPDATIDTVSEESEKDISEYSEEIRRSSMPPRVLSQREFEMIPKDEYDTVSMCYYMYDDSLVNASLDNWTVVGDIEFYIGNCLTKSRFDANDEEQLYVINYQQKEVYIIKKKWASYTA